MTNNTQGENDGFMRLQRFLARSGVASRRASEKLIAEGHVCVNGATVTEMGTKVHPGKDVVTVDGVRATLEEETVVIMLNKPMNCVSTMKDDHGQPTVAELVPLDRYPGLFPMGRLDRDTTGLLLFTNDGDLGHALLRPRGHVTKRYVALVEGRPDTRTLAELREGVLLDDGMTLPAEADVLCGEAYQKALSALDLPYPERKKMMRSRVRASEGRIDLPERSVVRIGIHEGRNRQVRRMLAAVGHPVIALHRASFGPLALGELPVGQWRVLTESEVGKLRECVRE